MANDPSPRQRGIQSIEVGGQLLKALAHHGRPLALKDLAREAGMGPAKAHPYLVSFGQLGLIAQDAASGRYGLGPLAMQLGLISLQQLDPLALATPVIDRLAAETGHTMALAVWGNRGATIVRVAQPATPVHVSMRHGTVMSLRGTASGRLFAAWLPKAQVLPVLKAEALLAGRKADGAFDAAFAAELATVRRDGISRAVGLSLPGVNALAAPVVDGSGQLVLALTAIGLVAVLDARAHSPPARLLIAEADALSQQLGHPGQD
jgi:DNA-binding IclR family transcriptional regulator